MALSRGHEVWVETGAGDSANFSDNNTASMELRLCMILRVFQANIILKVELTLKVDLMKGRQTLFQLFNSYKTRPTFNIY